METKKSTKASLENKRGLFFKIGLSFTLFLVFCAFEWTITPSNSFDLKNSDLFFDMDQIPNTVQNEKLEPPKVKPPILTFEITTDPSINDTTSDIFNNDTSTYTPPLKHLTYDSTDVEEVIKPYMAEKLPEFAGGHQAMIKWIKEHIKYPDVPKKQGITGTVYVSFVVGKDGSISNVQIPKKLDYDLDREGIRIVSLMPKWIPGTQNGRKARVEMILPLKFSLD